MITAYKGRGVVVGQRVFAYRNLHQAKWSLKATSGPDRGKVVAHADSLTLFGCELKVSEAGQRRVVREGRKNVHAGVVGLVMSQGKPPFGTPRKLSYNPYRGPFFMVGEDDIYAASYVHLDGNGKAWAIGSMS